MRIEIKSERLGEVTFDIGPWEFLQDLPPPGPISGSGTVTASGSLSCVGVTPAQLTLVRDQILAAITNAKNQVIAAMPVIPPDLVKKADLDAAVTEILDAIGNISTTPPAPAGYAKVGATQYNKLADAAVAVSVGGVVEIYGEMKDLNASAAFLKSCTIRGMTPDAKLNWTLGTSERMAFGKGLIVLNGAGNTYLIENLELTGARVIDRNGAGIRADENLTATVNNCNIHDNENGILSISSITVNDCTFRNNGIDNGSGHCAYINAQNVAQAIFEGCTFYAAIIGNQIKSRAKKTTVKHCTIAELDGQCSYQIDISNGGEVLIEKNVIEQGIHPDNWNMISYAPEGIPADGRVNTLTVTGNIFINDFVDGGEGVNLFNQPASYNISGNTFVGAFNNTILNGTGANTLFATRAAAGLAAYPALPAVPA